MESVALSPQAPSAERSSGQDLLKWLALFFMVVDHLRCISPLLAWTVFPGRLALPFFCLSIAFNIARIPAGDISFSACRRYIGWMALFAVISQPFYFFGAGRSPFDLNIFFVLLPALLLALGLKAGSGAGGRLLVAGLALTVLTYPLWGWSPVVVLLPAVMVIMVSASHRSRQGFWVVVAGGLAAMANLGVLLDAPADALTDPEVIARAAGIAVFSSLAPWIGLQIASRQWGSIPKVGMWAYSFYPAHFLVIGALAILAGR